MIEVEGGEGRGGGEEGRRNYRKVIYGGKKIPIFFGETILDFFINYR
jgi:hypothetical protein